MHRRNLLLKMELRSNPETLCAVRGAVAQLTERLGFSEPECRAVVLGVDEALRPQQPVTLVIRGSDGSTRQVKLTLRIDTPIEVDYFRHGGILPFVLRQLLSAPARS